MLALVVYESMFGNTKQIAEAVAEGVGAVLPVKTLEVRIAPVAMASDVDLLVVGGPTHIRGMSTERTRASAAAQPAHRTASDTIGICEWLEQLETPGANRMAAAFDTRVNAPQVLTGSAARGYAKRLAKAGFRVAAQPRSFLVRGRVAQASDALVPGELAAARAWGREVARSIKPGSAVRPDRLRSAVRPDRLRPAVRLGTPAPRRVRA